MNKPLQKPSRNSNKSEVPIYSIEDIINENKATNKVKKAQKPHLSLVDEAMPSEIRYGYWAIAAFLALLMIWAASVPLATGAIAPGIVSVEGNSKIVQHLNGGRIKDILTREGDLVFEGDTLITLEKKPLQTKLSALKSQYILLLSRESRLLAESNSNDKIIFSSWLLDRKDDPEIIEAMNSQRRIINSNRDLLREKEITYKHRISQASTNISSNRSRYQSTQARINNVKSELDNYQQLLARGLVTRNQTFSLENTHSQTQDQLASLQGSINSSRGLIAQYKAEVSEYKASQKHQAAIELDRLQDRIASVQKDLISTENLLMQTDIVAPISGYIVKLKSNTIGGVITPGQKIMEIVPNNKKLIIEARVDPKDRNSIKVGQTAEVRFSAFNRRSTLPINAKVVIVSADRLVDPTTNTPYYNTTIELLEDPAIKLSGAAIHPGMQTEVIIRTGERTTLNYLIAPLTQSFNRALREN